MQTISSWKARLDNARTVQEADAIIQEALDTGGRQELLNLLKALHEEFVDIDPAGGAHGTLERMRTLVAWLGLTLDDIANMGMKPIFFKPNSQ